MNNMKRQKDLALKDKFPRSVDAQYANEEEYRNSFKKMKSLSQSKDNAQLWMWLVMEVKSDAIKNNIAYESGMLEP